MNKKVLAVVTIGLMLVTIFNVISISAAENIEKEAEPLSDISPAGEIGVWGFVYEVLPGGYDRPLYEADVIAYFNQEEYERTLSNEGGYYHLVLDDLSDCRVTIKAEKDGYKTAMRSIYLPPSGELQESVDLYLEKLQEILPPIIINLS